MGERWRSPCVRRVCLPGNYSVEGVGRRGWRRQEEAASGSRKPCQNGLCQHRLMVKDCLHGVRCKVSMGLASRESYSNEIGKQIHIIMIQGFNGWWGHYSWCKLSKWSEGRNSSIKRAIEIKGVVNIVRRRKEEGGGLDLDGKQIQRKLFSFLFCFFKARDIWVCRWCVWTDSVERENLKIQRRENW